MGSARAERAHGCGRATVRIVAASAVVVLVSCRRGRGPRRWRHHARAGHTPSPSRLDRRWTRNSREPRARWPVRTARAPATPARRRRGRRRAPTEVAIDATRSVRERGPGDPGCRARRQARSRSSRDPGRPRCGSGAYGDGATRRPRAGTPHKRPHERPSSAPSPRPGRHPARRPVAVACDNRSTRRLDGYPPGLYSHDRIIAERLVGMRLPAPWPAARPSSRPPRLPPVPRPR